MIKFGFQSVIDFGTIFRRFLSIFYWFLTIVCWFFGFRWCQNRPRINKKIDFFIELAWSQLAKFVFFVDFQWISRFCKYVGPRHHSPNDQGHSYVDLCHCCAAQVSTLACSILRRILWCGTQVLDLGILCISYVDQCIDLLNRTRLCRPPTASSKTFFYLFFNLFAINFSIIFDIPFLSIFQRFWLPKPSQNRARIHQKSIKNPIIFWIDFYVDF